MDSKMGGTIREPANVLGDKGVDMVGIDAGMEASSVIVAKSITGSDALETSSSTLDGMDMVEICYGGNVTYEITNSSNIIDIT